MLTYKNDPQLKADLLVEIKKHEEADQIAQGAYGNNNEPDGEFCAVGCAIRSLNIKLGKDYRTSDHSVLEKEEIYPESLARIEDTLFEGLPKEFAKKWPYRFAEAVPVGKDLEPIKWRFCAFTLKENIERVLTLEIADDLKKQVVDAIRGCLKLQEDAIASGSWDGSAASAESAASAAWSAASAAWSAAWSAASAESAAWSAVSAAWSAASAARSAAWSAVSAVSAESAARSAAESAVSAVSAESAVSAAWSAASAESAASAAWSAASAASAARSAESAAYIKYADKLIELLKEV